MSGNSNDGSPSINRPNENENCQELVINTNLASPQASVIGNLNKGDILTIQTASDQGPIQAYDENGQLAGNIVSREQIRLLNCIIGGTEYEAEVLAIENGQCKVQIRAV
ncbi:hypothetical protein [Negadavirga shengliensis]|uniref:Uncharacterized protein n=1 Tax=Negadavirga shengliensis TaxID=1389218 RepID=A0ABV9T0D7_9BACT